ncbi:MAG TPA: YggT family protein [Candidatus Sulfotelmatobacter sp.]|nr:YggT family protein [Candidatus Sulfotelmatobacter sp.]
MGSVISVLNFIFDLYYAILIVKAVLPWVPHDRHHPLLRPFYQLTDPLLNTIKLGLPPAKIGYDVSPFVGLILVCLLQGFLTRFILGQ